MPAGVFRRRRNLPAVFSDQREASIRTHRAVIPAIDEVEVEIVPDAAFHREFCENSASSGDVSPKNKETSRRALKQWRRSLELLRGKDN